MEQLAMIESSLEYIENNLNRKLSLEKIANQFHFSKYYYHRLFSAVMGVSLNNYILDRKLNASVRLIKDTDQSLTEIGVSLDFSTPAAFSRAFKRRFEMSPSDFRRDPRYLNPSPIPEIVNRPLRNLNGDIVTDFTLEKRDAIKVSGVVFRIDITEDDYIRTIQGKFRELLIGLGSNFDTPGYVIYSDCSPDNKIFNVMVGVEGVVTLDLPLFFTVDVPDMYCVSFTYSGELYYMDEVLQSDFARFLKIAKKDADQEEINMIQQFDNIQDLESQYQIIVPIKENELDV